MNNSVIFWIFGLFPIILNNIKPIYDSLSTIKTTFKDKYKFTNWIDTNQSGSLIVVLSKKSTDLYVNINEKTHENVFKNRL